VRWSGSFPILAFMDGLLLAFALVEPLVQEKLHTIRARDEGMAPLRPEAAEPDAETEVVREPAHSVH
jgi:hypothetical protein